MTEAWVQSLFDEEPEVYGPKPAYDPAERRNRPVQQTTNHGGNKASRQDFGEKFYNAGNPLGAPPLDWWNVSEEEVHRRLILAMCPERVCRTCGEPSRRTSESESFFENGEKTKGGRFSRTIEGEAPLGHRASIVTYRTTTGWTDCGHDDWRPGVVLDPFA